MIRLGLGLSLASAAVLAVGPLGTRGGLWPFPVGFALLALGLLLGLAGASASLAAGVKTGQWGLAAVGVVVGLAVVAVPSRVLLAARGAPPIHEITTDDEDPPLFVAVLPLRASAANPPEYGGADVAAAQRRAFPDIAPLVLPVDSAQAFDRALRAVEDLAWDVVASDRPSGRIEAVATTFWFGFKDDVVVRLRPLDDGTRIDIRSKSRVGLGDLGANARRVRAFLRRVQDGD